MKNAKAVTFIAAAAFGTALAILSLTWQKGSTSADFVSFLNREYEKCLARDETEYTCKAYVVGLCVGHDGCNVNLVVTPAVTGSL